MLINSSVFKYVSICSTSEYKMQVLKKGEKQKNKAKKTDFFLKKKNAPHNTYFNKDYTSL